MIEFTDLGDKVKVEYTSKDALRFLEDFVNRDFDTETDVIDFLGEDDGNNGARLKIALKTIREEASQEPEGLAKMLMEFLIVAAEKKLDEIIGLGWEFPDHIKN